MAPCGRRASRRCPSPRFWRGPTPTRTGGWPGPESGHVLDNKNEKWENVNQALARGYPDLPGGDTLARLLSRERVRRNIGDLPYQGQARGAPGEAWVGLRRLLSGDAMLTTF